MQTPIKLTLANTREQDKTLWIDWAKVGAIIELHGCRASLQHDKAKTLLIMGKEDFYVEEDFATIYQRLGKLADV